MKQIMKLEFRGIRYAIKYCARYEKPFRVYEVHNRLTKYGGRVDSVHVVAKCGDLNSAMWHITNALDNTGRIA